MAFIPEGARWYLADLVMEMRVDGEAGALVHINTVLVRADSPEEAFQKATRLGEEAQNSYENTDGKTVDTRFRGLGDLNVIHDDLEHGAELTYQELPDLSDAEIADLVCPRAELGVFAPRRRSEGLNYMPREVMEMLEAEGVSKEDLFEDPEN